MANHRNKSYYDLALNNNTHNRIQTALQTGSLISNLASLHQTRKARLEAQEHHDDAMHGLDTVAQVVQENSQRAIAAANRNADLASKQRYSQWVGTTADGNLLHNTHIPLATKQITAIDVTLRMWREEILRRVAEAVGGLSPRDYGLLNRTSTPFAVTYDPKPAPPAQPQIQAVRGGRTSFIIIAAFLIGGLTGSLFGFSSAQETTLASQGYIYADRADLAELEQRNPEAAATLREGIELVLNEPPSTVAFGSGLVAGIPREEFTSSMLVTPAEGGTYRITHDEDGTYHRSYDSVQASAASLNTLVGRIAAGGMIGSFGLPVLAVFVLYLLRRRRVKHLAAEHQVHIEQWQQDCDEIHDENTRRHQQLLTDTENARDQVLAQLATELGFEVDSSEVMDTLFVHQDRVLAHRDRMDAFIRTAYLENPLQNTWVPLMTAPGVSAHWAGTPLEDFARKLYDTLLDLNIWAKPAASPQHQMS